MAYGQNILFDALGNILQRKSEDVFQKHIAMEDFEKQFPRYMVLRYLSMAKPEVAQIVLDNQLSLERMPSNKAVYRFLMNEIPQQKSAFIKYLK